MSKTSFNFYKNNQSIHEKIPFIVTKPWMTTIYHSPSKKRSCKNLIENDIHDSISIKRFKTIQALETNHLDTPRQFKKRLRDLNQSISLEPKRPRIDNYDNLKQIVPYKKKNECASIFH